MNKEENEKSARIELQLVVNFLPNFELYRLEFVGGTLKFRATIRDVQDVRQRDVNTISVYV